MKKIFIWISVFLLSTVDFFSQTTYTWTGSTNSDFFTSSNWNPNTGTPGSTDNALFNSGSNPCTITNSIAVNSFSIESGYSGVVDMGSSYHVIAGNVVVNSGTLISTSDVLEIDDFSGSNDFNLGGSGVFNNNSGSIDVYSAVGTTFSFNGNVVLSTLNLVATGGGSNSLRTINFGSNLVSDNLNLVSPSTKAYDYQGTIHIKVGLDLGNAANTNVSTSNTANFIFDGSNASIVGSTSAGASKAYLPNIQINTTGNLDITRSINLLGNWTGAQGTLTAGTSTVNMYGSSATISGTAAAFDNLVLQTGASVTFPSSAEVLIGKSFANGGTVSFPTTCTLGLNGVASVTQNITGTGFTISGIHAYSNTRTINLSTTVAVLDFLDLDAGVTFATSSNLTLKSTNALTARLGALGAGASITGSVTVETVIPGGSTGWANLGVRGVNAQTISNWDTYVSSGAANGMPMTCIGCAYTPSDVPTGWFKSIQGWDESSSYGYDSTVTSSTAMNPGTGFWVYVGDGFSTTNDLKVINSGTLKTGQVVIGVTNFAQSGFNLIANPYPSPISWNKVMAVSSNSSSINGAIYAFNANSGIYTSYSGSLASNPAPNGIDSVIAGGQGFYVESASGGVVTFQEYMKVSKNTSANPLIRTSANSGVGKVLRIKLAGSADNDVTTIRIHQDATPNFDKVFDAKKLVASPGYIGYPGAYDKYTTISTTDILNEFYSINSLPPLSNSLSVPILARVSTSGTYTLQTYDFKDFDMCVGLIDKLDNSYHDIRNAPYVFTISDTTSAPRFELILCKDESLNTVGVSQNASESNSILIGQDATNAFVKTVFEKNTKASISVFNIMGQKLVNDIQVEGTVTTTALPLELHNQVVLIKVTTDKESVTKKVVLH